MSAKETLRHWLAQDYMEEVLQGLFSLAEKYGDERLLNSATFQSGRRKAIETKKIEGVLSHENEILESAKIRDALLQIISKLPEAWVLDGMGNKTISNPAIEKKDWKKYAAYIAGVVAVLAGVAEVSGYNLRDIFKNDKKTESILKPSQPSHRASTSGDRSPAIITKDGDVNISYGETQSVKDTTKKQNPTQ